eukprot:2535707-Prymnesium_polylepis.1
MARSTSSMLGALRGVEGGAVVLRRLVQRHLLVDRIAHDGRDEEQQITEDVEPRRRDLRRRMQDRGRAHVRLRAIAAARVSFCQAALRRLQKRVRPSLLAVGREVDHGLVLRVLGRDKRLGLHAALLQRRPRLKETVVLHRLHTPSKKRIGVLNGGADTGEDIGTDGQARPTVLPSGGREMSRNVHTTSTGRPETSLGGEGTTR